jgi:hypothetical protein
VLKCDFDGCCRAPFSRKGRNVKKFDVVPSAQIVKNAVFSCDQGFIEFIKDIRKVSGFRTKYARSAFNRTALRIGLLRAGNYGFSQRRTQVSESLLRYLMANWKQRRLSPAVFRSAFQNQIVCCAARATEIGDVLRFSLRYFCPSLSAQTVTKIRTSLRECCMLLIVIAGPAVCVKLHNRGKPAVIMADSRWIKDNDWNLFRALRPPLA